MKKLVLISFCGLLLISSCASNDNKDTEVNTTDTLNAPVATTPPADGTTTDGTVKARTLSDEDFRRLYDIEHYSDAEVREYRRMHDEMDWGTVAGFYPEGSTRAITESDTKFLTKWGHAVMLNEIYARHGMTFQDDDLKSHFAGQDWYHGTNSNVQSLLTEQEKQNISFLANNQPK